ncbi:hypothetical protein [Tunturiibacter gelidiferens]
MMQLLPFEGRFGDSADLVVRDDWNVFLERRDRNEADEATGF